MKTIILISSIFYILGLKISHSIDMLKHPSHPVGNAVIQHSKTDNPATKIDFKDAESLKQAKDSVRRGGITDQILENK